MSFVTTRVDNTSRNAKYSTLPNHTKTVTWKIHWKAPAKMMGFLLVGASVAVGHHLYYQSLDGKQIITTGSSYKLSDNSTWNLRSQEWQIRYGTAFAFFAKTCFAASIGVAYQQHIWTSMKRKSVSISGIDATFGAINDLSSFLSSSFLLNVKVGAVLAALTWLMPLSALITPATLTVVPSAKMISRNMLVPMVDYTNTSSLFVYSDSNVGIDANTVDNGISPFLSRLMAATASGLDILPMAAIAPAANYSLSFTAPSFRCDTAQDNITTVIDQVVKYTSSITKSWMISFIAFTPQDQMLIDSGANYHHYQEFVDACIGGVSGVDGSKFYCDGMAAAHDDYPGSSTLIWVKADDDYYSCSLEDTLFNVTFNASNTIQTINHPYSFEYTGQGLKTGYYVHGQVVSNWMSGVLWGMAQGMASVRTRIIQTSLYAALKTNGQRESNRDGIAEAAIPTADRALTRGLSMGQLIEELSRNVTLSLFSADRTWTEAGVNTTVNIASNHNIYAYNSVNLWLAYGIAIMVTAISVGIGLKALIVNGVSHGTSFSAIMCSTRNTTLDNLTIGHSLAAEPLEKGLLDTKLRFGILLGSNKANLAQRRLGFGVAGEVEIISKSASCC